MSSVFAGSDGSFVTAWQSWKRRNHEYESFVIGTAETMVFRNEGGDQAYVWYVGIDEAELPEDVELDGNSVRDRRQE
jgi:hypothetical protein